MAVLFRRLTILVEPGHHNHIVIMIIALNIIALMKHIAGLIFHNDDLRPILVDGMN